MPAPHAAVVLRRPLPVEVLDADGAPVGVDGRGMVSAPLAQLSSGGAAPVSVEGWAGPWVLDERWWDPVAHRRRARFQVVLADGSAHLLAIEAGTWWLEATYD